ncbi:hypothetical protein D5086_018416 [Populus alba]|uniref:Uncharacterized protein n=1 Tax=Populus alba TaxID=43335 RepID=A0ACC4BRA5_POPAL
MRHERGGTMVAELSIHRPTFGSLLHSDPAFFSNQEEVDDSSSKNSQTSSNMSPRYYNGSTPPSGEGSPYLSPWNQPSPYTKSPWIFTGHQDGKIRVWRASSRNPSAYKRVGTVPTLKDYVKSSVNPKNYVEVRRHRNVLRIKHFDAVSCLSLNEDQGLLYSGSWDKTLKVWRTSDYKCLESIKAHDDAINSVVTGFDSLVFTGSADGTVKVWRRELQGRRTGHFLVQTLLKQENAVTALSVNQESAVIYCGSSDGLVNFWEREKHLSHGGVLRGHKMAVLCLASAGNLVFSGSADKSICVWRREAGGVHICLSVLTGHGGPVKCLAVEEDRESDEGDQHWIVYSGSLDKSVKVHANRGPCSYAMERGLKWCESIHGSLDSGDQIAWMVGLQDMDIHGVDGSDMHVVKGSY